MVSEDKDTTKLRIVFDGSSKTCNVSLNDCLLKGPNITPLIFDIILRFRLFPIAITAHIKKAFLQMGIKETDRNYLQFLWVDDILKENPKLIRSRFARVVFGGTSSPFLLMQQYANITINIPPLTQAMFKKPCCRFLSTTLPEESFQLTRRLSCIKS